MSSAAIGAAQTRLRAFVNPDEGQAVNRNGMIQFVSKTLMDNSCPMTLRKLIEVQHSHEGIRLNVPDGQSIHIRALSAATVGSVFTLATRIVRTVGSTILLPLSLPYAAGKASRYSLEGEMGDTLKATADEWKDLGVALLCVPIGLAKTVKPSFANQTITDLRDYYFTRIDERTARDLYVKRHMEEYARKQAAVLAAWNSGLGYPVSSAR